MTDLCDYKEAEDECEKCVQQALKIDPLNIDAL